MPVRYFLILMHTLEKSAFVQVGSNQLKPYGQSVTVTCGEADGRQAGKIGGDRKDVL